MRIPIPEKFQLGSFDIHVKMVSADEILTVGEYRGYSQTIRIDREMNENLLQGVFVHELIEAINDTYELGLEHPKIQVLSMALAQIIRDLPESSKELSCAEELEQAQAAAKKKVKRNA